MAKTKPAKKPASKTAAESAAEAKRAAASAKLAAARAKAATLRDKTKSHGSGFMNFIREQGVIGLAVGLAIGAAAGDTVKQLVGAFIDPVVQLIIGSQEGLKAASFTVEMFGRKAEFSWGAFVSSLITLLAVAFVIYFIVKGMKLDKLDKKKDS